MELSYGIFLVAISFVLLLRGVKQWSVSGVWSSNLMRMLKICYRSPPVRQYCSFTKVKDGGRHHRAFRKSVAISLLLNQSSPNLLGLMRILHRRQLFRKKCKCTKIKDGGRRHREFRKYVAIFLLLHQSSPNVMGLFRMCNRTQLLH